MSRLRPRLPVVLCAIAMMVALRFALLSFGRVLVMVLRGDAITHMVLPGLGMIGCLLGFFVAFFFYDRRRVKNRFDGALLITTLMAAFAIGWVGTVYSYRVASVAQFGRALTYYPNSDFFETVPARPRVHYSINARGFRGPDFNDEKGPGTTRIVTLGDSFVFGSGVEVEDTLARQLETALSARFPGRRFEVLNLGIPGDNITSHVDVYEEVQKHLQADAIVLGLTLPNDLSRWDGQDERREPKHFGLYSAVTYLLGLQAAIFIYGEALLESRVTPEGIAHLTEEVNRLTALRTPAAPPLFVLPYSQDEQCLRTFAGKPGITVVTPNEVREDYFIPNDGHPTAAGNHYFAGILSETMAASLHFLSHP